MYVCVNELAEIRAELDEHLETLNQNTAEVLAAMEYLGEMERRLEKLSERMDLMQEIVMPRCSVREVQLTRKEREVLQALTGAVEPLTSGQIGKRVGLTADLVAQTLFCLGQKGIAILAHVLDERTFYALDNQFKNELNCSFYDCK